MFNRARGQIVASRFCCVVWHESDRKWYFPMASLLDLCTNIRSTMSTRKSLCCGWIKIMKFWYVFVGLENVFKISHCNPLCQNSQIMYQRNFSMNIKILKHHAECIFEQINSKLSIIINLRIDDDGSFFQYEILQNIHMYNEKILYKVNYQQMGQYCLVVFSDKQHIDQFYFLHFLDLSKFEELVWKIHRQWLPTSKNKQKWNNDTCHNHDIR